MDHETKSQLWRGFRLMLGALLILGAAAFALAQSAPADDAPAAQASGCHVSAEALKDYMVRFEAQGAGVRAFLAGSKHERLVFAVRTPGFAAPDLDLGEESMLFLWRGEGSFLGSPVDAGWLSIAWVRDGCVIARTNAPPAVAKVILGMFVGEAS